MFCVLYIKIISYDSTPFPSASYMDMKDFNVNNIENNIQTFKGKKN
jgi:hypothetical protein